MICKSHTHTPLTLDQLDLTSPHGTCNRWSRVSGVMACVSKTRLTLHRLQVLHVQGGGAAHAGRGRHGRQQVGGVRAAVARQQSHLVVVLGRGQTCGGGE